MAPTQTIDDKVLVCLEWEESERGWGTRPDGFSLHKSKADCKDYVAEYWNKLPNKVQDEYERPIDGIAPYFVKTTQKLYDEVIKSKNGIRIYDNKMFKELDKVQGGIDGQIQNKK